MEETEETEEMEAQGLPAELVQRAKHLVRLKLAKVVREETVEQEEMEALGELVHQELRYLFIWHLEIL